MKSRGIITKSSIIENPFRKDVTNKYAATALKLIKLLKGRAALDYLLKTVYNNFLNISMSKQAFLKFLTDEHEWMHGFLYITICDLSMKITHDKDFYYNIGKESLNPNFLHVTTTKLLSLKTVYKYVQLQNKNFNNLTELYLDKKIFRNGFGIFYKKTHNWYKNELVERYGRENCLRILKNDCILTKGVLQAVPLRYKRKHAIIAQEPKCEGSGDDVCEIHLKWEPEKFREKMQSMIFILPKYRQMENKLLQMEYVIKERTEQLEKSKKDIYLAYSKIKLLKEALGEKESEALLNVGFDYIDENKLEEAEKALDLIIDKKDTLVYQYETPSLSNIYFLNKKRIGNLKDIWTIKRYDNPKDASIAYHTYKKLFEYTKIANVKVPQAKIPIKKYLIVQEISGISLYELFSKYEEYKKAPMLNALLEKHISDTAFIQSQHFNYHAIPQNFSEKLTQAIETLLTHYGMKFDIARIRRFSRHITKDFTKGLIRHRDSSLKNTKLISKGHESLAENLYQIDFEKMARITFMSDNILRITESPLLQISEKEKLWYHYLFLLLHHKYLSKGKVGKWGDIIINSRDNATKEGIIDAIGIKKYALYFLSHDEKIFYRHLRSIYHQLKPSNKSINVEHLRHHKIQAIKSLEKIKKSSALKVFKEDIEYAISNLQG